MNLAGMLSRSCDGTKAPSPAPPPPRFARYASSGGPPPPAIAEAEGASALIPPTPVRPRLADQSNEFFRLKEMKGGGAPVGATVPWGLATQRMSPSICASGEGRASSGTRSPLGAPPRLCPRFLGLGFSTPGQVSWDAAVRGRYPLFPVPVQRLHPAHRP